VQPSGKYADIVSQAKSHDRPLILFQIVPGHENHVAIDLITTHVRRMLNERSSAFRQRMVDSQTRLANMAPPDLGKMLMVLPQTAQLKVPF
jgi:hypothetical protein